MDGKWTVQDNHIVIKTDSCVLHPSASEIYEMLETEQLIANVNVPPLKESLSQIRFSKVGSDIKINIKNENQGNGILLEVFCERKGSLINVDVINGKIIDQCVYNGEWFYVTGIVDVLEDLFHEINIFNAGTITVEQYIKLLQKKEIIGENTLSDNLQLGLLNKSIDTKVLLPKGLSANLYNYQKEGFLWMDYMLQENPGCILGDEMGLGKTLQVITLLQLHKNRDKGPSLVIAPVSLLSNWKRECAKFAPSLRVCVHHGTNRTGLYKQLREYDVVVISYSTAITDASLLAMIQWDMVVLDEAQNIKNPDSKRSLFVKQIPRNNSIAVSGTPFENHVTDIWSIVDFVMPDALGTLGQFRATISDDVYGAEQLEPILSSIMIRRLVKDVAKDLPEKIIISQPITMSEREAIQYDDYRKQIAKSCENGNVGLGSLQKLRMFCTHPQLVDNDWELDPFNSSYKYQRLCEILGEIISRNEKAILFTSYIEMFKILNTDIPARFNIPVWNINGSTFVNERQEIVDSFNQSEGAGLLVLNPRAAGAGLNITGANHVIHYNLEWNPSLEDQASARSYRRGQNKTVFIYRLFYEDTVESYVNQKIENKREMSESAVVGTDGLSENKKDIIAALAISPICGERN